MLQTSQNQSLVHHPRVNVPAARVPGRNRAFIARTRLPVPSRALCYCSKASSREPSKLHQSNPSNASISALQAPARMNPPRKDYSTSHPFQQSYPYSTVLVQRSLKTYLRSSFQRHAPAPLTPTGQGAWAPESQQSPSPHTH